MKFKDWMLQEINKGLERTFRAQNPHLPHYVASQVLHNRIAPLWRNVQAGQASTMAPRQSPRPMVSMDTNVAPPVGAQVMDKNDVWTKPTIGNQNPPSFSKKHPTYNTPSAMYKDPSVSNIAQKPDWRLQRVLLRPSDFDEQTISLFLAHEFGSSPSLSQDIRNHDQRMTVQNQLVNDGKPGGNEPIVLIRKGKKFAIQEGWHRLYALLLNRSASPEERAKVLNGQIQNVDFNKWRPILINAYVGSNPESVA